MMIRKPNILECKYKGFKLSNIETNIKTSSDIILVSIGSISDYTEERKCKRVKISVETKNNIHEIDLEDVLVFSKKYCAGIFERIFKND